MTMPQKLVLGAAIGLGILGGFWLHWMFPDFAGAMPLL